MGRQLQNEAVLPLPVVQKLDLVGAATAGAHTARCERTLQVQQAALSVTHDHVQPQIAIPRKLRIERTPLPLPRVPVARAQFSKRFAKRGAPRLHEVPVAKSRLSERIAKSHLSERVTKRSARPAQHPPRVTRK